MDVIFFVFGIVVAVSCFLLPVLTAQVVNNFVWFLIHVGVIIVTGGFLLFYLSINLPWQFCDMSAQNGWEIWDCHPWIVRPWMVVGAIAILWILLGLRAWRESAHNREVK